MVTRLAVAASVFFFGFAPLRAQDIRLRAKTDTDTSLIGGWIDVHVECSSPFALDSIGPVVRDSIGPFEVLQVKRAPADSSWLIRVTATDSLKAFFPPVEFDYRLHGDTTVRRAYTNSLLLTVTGIPIDPQADIKDITPPMSAPWLLEDFLPYLIGLVAVVVIVLAVWYYRRMRKKKNALLEEIKIVVPPHKEALAALRVLEEKKLWQQGHVKEYYSEVTEIIRRFFERRWSVIALEMTTGEILEQMKHVPEALLVWRDLSAFFETADLVKFAKVRPSPTDHENEMRTAYEIVRAMVPKEPAMPVQAPEEVPADVR